MPSPLRRRRRRLFLAALYLFLVALVVSPAPAQSPPEPESEPPPWTGQLADGAVIAAADLARILADHQAWLESGGEQGRRADLSGANLSRASLPGVDLRGADLREANLSSADLTGAHLRDAELSGANLSDARLPGAHLQGARLIWANLRGAHLAGADLTLADLSLADLSAADLTRARLPRACLRQANVQGAQLPDADLAGAELAGADFRRAAGLNQTQLHRGRTWILARYSPDLLASLGLPDNHDAKVLHRDLSHYQLPGVDLAGASLAGLHLSRADLRGANLSAADLTGADLSGANLSGAHLIDAVLAGAALADADFRRADGLLPAQLYRGRTWVLSKYSSALLRALGLPYDHNTRVARRDLSGYQLPGVDLSGAVLPGVNLQRADLTGVRLADADLRAADLTAAGLRGADLRRADLTHADLTGADLRQADLLWSRLEGARLFNARGLPELRDSFRRADARPQERRLTYALKHTEALQALSAGGWPALSAALRCLLFDLTCQYGMNPGRCLLILIGGVFVFAPFYLLALRSRRPDTGLWRLPLGPPLPAAGPPPPEKLTAASFTSCRPLRALGLALYFSLLSALRLGWREFTVGHWLTRLQQQPYTLRATGWVRTVSGFQSLLSLYLLALWALSAFGRPFE